MRIHRCFVRCVVVLLVIGSAGVLATASAAEIVLGGMCDRTGPTKIVGTNMCPGSFDYVNLVNKKGGVNGNTIRWMEVDHAYKVDRGVEAYERLKRAGALAMVDYGTPVVYALTPRHTEDKILGMTPGFGRADASDGERYPYIFPAAASYWSQMGASMQYIKDHGARKGSKIAYLYYDNPAGREPLHIFERICKLEGYNCRTFAVPPPGVEMASQVLDIVRRMRANWVVTHLFGKSPSLSLRELRKNGFPLNKVIGLVWGAGEHDMIAAGWKTAQGYLGVQFAGVGRHFPVIQEIMQMYKDKGEAVPAIVGTVYYNRGVFNAAILVEAVRQAIQRYGLPLTGEKVKDGFEHVSNFSLGGLIPPLNFTPQDHEGGGWVKLYQTKGEQLVAYTDWFHGYRDIVLDEIKKSGAK